MKIKDVRLNLKLPRVEIKKVEINWGAVGKRAGAGAAAAALLAREKPELVTSRSGWVALGGAFLLGAVPFGGGSSAGILTAVPGAASLLQAAAAALAGPKEQRRQQADALKAQAAQALKDLARQEGAAAAQEILNRTNMAGFPAGQLGQATPPATAATGDTQ